MKREFKITGASGGAAFTVRVVTRASKTEFAGIQEDGILKVRLTASPNEGEANKQLIEFLAGALGVQTHQIEIVAGGNSRDKLVSVDAIAPEVLEQKLHSMVSEEE
jgi:hypothetical protein